jgi:hypothetical protein
MRTLIVALTTAAAVTQQCNTSSSSSSSGSASTQNFQTITVNAGPTNDYFNGAFTTVTVCVPGQSTCQTIDGVLIDTGSSGLRLLASLLTVPLPQQTDANGSPVAECGQFVDGFTWGPVVTADVRLGAEQASAVPIQSIGPSGFAVVPTDCANTGTAENTVDTLGANGVLGVGLFRQDCGPACTVTGPANPGFYYACPSSGCVVIAQPLTRQLQNPVWLFPTDNNGIAIQLPSVPAGGAPSVSGMMVFGIGTQTNNPLGSAKVFTVDAAGNITTVYSGQSYGSSYIDSGSNGLYFLDSPTTGLPVCSSNADFYCPPALQTLTAIHRGANGITGLVTFTVGNADTLNERFSAFGEVAGPNPATFDWGLPFFYGRTIFTAIEGQITPAGVGPYFAY